jgi:hypothetical protein
MQVKNFLFFLFFLFLILSFFYFFYFQEKEVSALSKIAQDIPDDSSILVNFYSGDTLNKSVILAGKKAKPAVGNENCDVLISMPLKYMHKFEEQDVCAAVKEAAQSGEVEFKTNLSEVQLLMKFKPMLKYSGCAGFDKL